MPVATRSQSRKNQMLNNIAINDIAVNEKTTENKLTGHEFIEKIKELLRLVDEATTRSNKLKITVQIFKTVNANLQNIINSDGIDKWINFSATVYLKIIEFEDDYFSRSFNDITDNKLLSEFLAELHKPKDYLINLLLNYDVERLDSGKINNKQNVARAKKLINERRPRRLIKPINYTYMDIIEPASKYDGITDIWADPTIDEDPDYDPNEDNEEDEDDPELEQYKDDYDDENNGDTSKKVLIEYNFKSDTVLHTHYTCANHILQYVQNRINKKEYPMNGDFTIEFKWREGTK